MVTSITHKSIFEFIEYKPCNILLNPVNTKGVMSKGFALEIKNRYPECFKKYKNFCYNKKYVGPGMVQICSCSDENIDYIGNVFTKDDWRDKSKRAYIFDCIQNLRKWVDENRKSFGEKVIIYTPKIGCGLGGLDFHTDVLPAFNYFFNLSEDIEVYIFDK